MNVLAKNLSGNNNGQQAEQSKPLIDKKLFVEGLKERKNNQKNFIELTTQARLDILKAAQFNLDSGFYKNNSKECATEICLAIDELIVNLFLFISRDVFAHPTPTEAKSMALIAVGGYGAGRLAPFSDIDLLFLSPGKPTKWNEQCVEFMLRLLWDSGFKIGYSVRDIKNSNMNAKEDMMFCTSLLDARFLNGEITLFEDWQKQFTKVKISIKPRRFVKAKLAERDERHEKEGRSRFLVEPNIKNSKGGLRDLQTLWWLIKFCHNVSSKDDLQHTGIFTPLEYQILDDCEKLLWEARCHLHFLCGSAVERLSFHHQPALAAKMGFENKEDNLAVEQFMKFYFLKASDAGSLTRILCAQLEASQAKPLPKISQLIKRITKHNKNNVQLEKDLVIETGRLNTKTPEKFLENPLMMLRFFEIAAIHDINFHPQALNQIRQALPQTDEGLRKNPSANKMFLKILTSNKNPERILRTMNETGLLGWFFLDFGKIVGLMQFNMYHHYTVDEHLIHSVGQLAQIERSTDRDMKLPRRIANSLYKKENCRNILYISMLTHDISKGQGGDHSKLGADVCLDLAIRCGLCLEDREKSAWLVRNHLLMSDYAQKRDLADPKTIRNFVRQVGDKKKLQLLFLLTIADIKAVGPGTWNGWKAQLLENLYQASLDELRMPAPAKMAATARKARSAFVGNLNWTPKAKRDYVKLHSDSYWANTSIETQIRQVKLWQSWQEKTPFAFEAVDLKEIGSSEVSLIIPDHPGLFSRIVGALAISELQITDARIFTTQNGLAFDNFLVQTANKTPIGAEHSLRLKDIIEKVLLGELLPLEEIDKKLALAPVNNAVFDIVPNIEFDNDASYEYSVIEVDCLDSPYLLFSLAQRIFRAGLVLASAHITTYGERAVDVFYIKDMTGQKITSEEKQKHLIAELTNACGRKALAIPS